MKISIYALHLGFGGVEKYVITLANVLCTEHRVELISTYKMTDEPAFALDSRVKVCYLLENVRPNKEELRESFRKKQPFRLLKEGFKAIKVLWMRRKVNIASLKHCQSDVILSTRIFHNKLIGRYAPKSAVKLTGEHNHHNGNETYKRKVIASCRGFDYFIPISKELSEDYRAPMQEIGVETLYIPFCIDPNPNPIAPDFASQDLIAVGRLSPEKGFYELLDVFENIHRRLGAARLHIVGDGEEARGLRTAAEEKGLGDCVVFHGFRNKAYIYQLLPKNALYLMTSFTESFGIVLLEAMSCGIPCIAYSSAKGAHEIIENGKNGYLIEDRNREDFCRTVCDLLADPQKRRELSRGALETAEAYSVEATKTAWLSLMKRIGETRT